MIKTEVDRKEVIDNVTLRWFVLTYTGELAANRAKLKLANWLIRLRLTPQYARLYNDYNTHN